MTGSLHGLRATGLGIAVGGRWLVRGLDLDVEPGELWAVIGPNGAGKSTLLRHLAGLVAPQEGRVALGGQALHALEARTRARSLAYLPQRTTLYHDLRVEEVVALGRAPHQGRFGLPTTDDRDAVDGALLRVGLTALRGRSASTLSGGERQRVMLARMLATDTSVLVLDEPTTALDVGHALDFLGLCRQLVQSGRSVVMAIHELDLARRHADKALCLKGDGAHVSGPVDTVFTPEVLEPAFGVRVRQGQALVFDPP